MHKTRKAVVVKWIDLVLKTAGGIFLLLLVVAAIQPENARKWTEKISEIPQHITSIPLQTRYDFAGEEIPMESFDLKERLDRELMVNTYRHSYTLQYLKLAHRYFPVIEPILKEKGIPDDFKYLAVAESGLRNVSSPAGAKGFWQLMEPISKDLGLEIYDEVDERYHLEKSTRAACDYLLRLHGRFGNWINAAAAYNVGPTNFSRYLSEQNQDHYFDLNITDETMRYVFRLVAIKTIMENPENFGYRVLDQEKYAPLNDYFTVTLDTSVTDLGAFARQNGTSYRMLKIYNPWLRSNELTVKNNTYYIRIPKT